MATLTSFIAAFSTKLPFRQSRAICTASLLLQNVAGQNTSLVQGDERKVSKAMKSYMERANKQEEFIKQQLLDFQISKRHLANMMGRDPEFFTEKDVDEAVSYLFPSGLFDPRARPMMKHPDEIYPKCKAAEFDISGRPYHSLFYTSKANYFQFLHDAAMKLNYLNRHEDRTLSQGKKPEQSSELVFAASEWLPKDKIETILMENITDNQYSTFLKTFERLSRHAYAYIEKDFIMQFRRNLAPPSELQDIPKLLLDESGRPYMMAKGRRKRAEAEVKVIGHGSGQIDINGKDILYFESRQEREQVIFPLELSKMLGHVDLVATVAGGGPSGQAGAIRYALSICLRSFVDKETVERMRLAGLLSFDPRCKERKKPGQAGARKKFTWKKR